MLKFSVLIAHLNNSSYFKDCYFSLVNQTYKNWNAIIVDDGSSETEKKNLKSIIEGDERFTYYENQKNFGVGVTKKKLIDLATGNICAFLDPDDALAPTAIETCIKIFSKNIDVVLTYSRFIKCDENLTPQLAFKSAMQVQNNDPYFFNFPVQIAHFVAFRKDVYEKTEGINTSLKIAEDQDLYLKLYELGKVYFINETNYLYRTHSKGISQTENKPKSHEYFGKVIFNAMKRRGLTTINGKKIPSTYSNPKEIYKLLEYQNSIRFRALKKIKILFQ